MLTGLCELGESLHHRDGQDHHATDANSQFVCIALDL